MPFRCISNVELPVSTSYSRNKSVLQHYARAACIRPHSLLLVNVNSRLRDSVKGLIIPVLRFLVIPRNDGTSNGYPGPLRNGTELVRQTCADYRQVLEYGEKRKSVNYRKTAAILRA